MRIDFAISAVVVPAIPLRANSTIAALTNRPRVAIFCSCRVTACIVVFVTEYLLSEYVLTLRPKRLSVKTRSAQVTSGRSAAAPIPLPSQDVALHAKYYLPRPLGCRRGRASAAGEVLLSRERACLSGAEGM